jgi:hypothetical protein
MPENRHNRLFARLLRFVVLAFSMSGLPAESHAALIERKIFPSVTDPAITNGVPPTRHFVYLDDATPHPGKLFVFLAGTAGPPAAYTNILRTAAQIGYHSVGLVYPNELSINEDICPGQPATCPEDVRLEIVTGADTSPLVEVNRANCIENRLIKLVQYLHQNFPTEGWTNFLTGGDLRWELLAVAGHSQGGGHAAMIGKIHQVHRVAMFSSTEPAAWTLEPLLTPPAQFAGFAHTLEDSFNGITLSWARFAVPGPLTNVDASAPPFDGSRRLATTAIPRDGSNYHGCVVVDSATPLQADGVTPLFRDHWIYMIGPAGSGPDPLPVTPSIAGTNLTLNWPSMPGEQFAVERRPNLSMNEDWTLLTSNLFAPSFSQTHVVSNALSTNTGFFRVRRK